MDFKGFIGGSYKMDARSFDLQRCVNQYPISSESGTSKSPSALRSVAGYTLFSTIGGGAIRGARTCANGRGFVVSGFELYEISETGVGSLLGTLQTGAGIVSIAENGTQLIIVDGQYGYIYNMNTSTFTQITDPDFPACSVVDYLDGFFIVVSRNTANIYTSGLYDGLTWDALDTDRADAYPDNLVSLVAAYGNLWLFGELGTEVWQNTAKTLGTSFERIGGAIIPSGCAAKFTVQKFDNTVLWLGKDEQGRGVVWRANGYSSAERISTQAIESMIQSAGDYSESYAYTYYEQGHLFYVLQINGLDTTLVYDGATGFWHERQFYNSTTGNLTQHRGMCNFFFKSKNLIGDSQSGALFDQSLSKYTFNDEEIRRIRITPHIQQEKTNLTYSSFELDMEPAVANSSVPLPQIVLKYSDDGGNTWSNEKWVTVGALGKYKTRVRWTRLGSARDRVFWVQYSEPTFYQVNGAYINVP